MDEDQNIEYKESWRDEYLKWVCGFANAQGGKIFIGIDDHGQVAGVEDYKKLMDEIPNKTMNHLGLVVDVNLHKKENKHYIEIDIPVSSVPISYHGAYHYRSGSTKQELKGIALQNLLLKKIGKKWEDLPVEGATLADLNETTIQLFIERAIEKGRISSDARKSDTEVLLKNLKLMTEQRQLTNAALLLFGKNPAKISVTASFKIGRFGKSSSDLLFQDIIETNIFDMYEKVIETLKAKYLIRPISYKGGERMEPLEYPEPALREAVLNAIIHKNYSSTYIFLRVYDDQLYLCNPGNLPEELRIGELKGRHSSYPRNQNIADEFFKAGYIEAWGRGTNEMIDACIKVGLPEPIIKEEQGGISIAFLKDIYTDEYLRKLDLNERQVRGILHTKAKSEITNEENQKLNKESERTALRAFQDVTSKGLFERKGVTGRGTVYVLKRS